MSEKGKVLSRLIISIIVIGILVLTAYFLLKHFNLLDIKRETIQNSILMLNHQFETCSDTGFVL